MAPLRRIFVAVASCSFCVQQGAAIRSNVQSNAAAESASVLEEASEQNPGPPYYQQQGNPQYPQQQYPGKPGQHGGMGYPQMNQRMQAIIGQLGLAQRGRKPGEALIPALVPGPNETFVLKNKEKTNGMEFITTMADTNKYSWELDEVVDAFGMTHEPEFKFAKLKGKWTSNQFGHKSVHVYNNHKEEMFKIRAVKHTWNPFKLRWSFRILPPGSKDNDDALFTITKDIIGRGFLWLKSEWTIYRGRMKDNGRGEAYDVLYYATGSYMGWDFKIYHNREEYDAGVRPCAEINQKINAGAVFAAGFLPDKFKLEVRQGEDSALLLAMSTIMDMYSDNKDAQRNSD